MKKLLLSLSCLTLACAVNAQTTEHCGASTVHNRKLAEDPVYAQKMAAFDARLQQPQDNYVAFSTTTNVIPVVVHVMHLGEEVGTGTNISDNDIRERIQALNQRYRKIEGSWGDGNGVDVEIEFALAVRDPEGNCTNGITRTDMSGYPDYAANGVEFNEIGMDDEDLKEISFWDSNNYYNIWVISEFDNGTTGIDGYAYPSTSHGADHDGAVILYSSFQDPESSTTAHELGHALNLYHSFEGDNNGEDCPPVPNGCGSGQGDCCEDTAPHKRSTVGDCGAAGVNECDGGSTDMSFRENYMDYAGVCRNMFTPNQKTRMQAALEERASLLAVNGNMSLVPPSAPEADFYIINGYLVCQDADTPLELINTSSCIPNNYLAESDWGEDISFLWTISNGTDTYTFTEQNPVITIPQPGSYSVSLEVTNADGTDTKTIEDALLVTDAAPAEVCEPETEENGYFAHAIGNVTFNTINNSTSTVIGGPYMNYTCSKNTLVQAGETYPISITVRANTDFTERFRAYIDYNNNGIFEQPELVFEGEGPVNQTSIHTGNVTIPANAVQNTLLTMRVMGDAEDITSNKVMCIDEFFVADVEDYGIYITSTAGIDDENFASVTISPNPAQTAFTITGSTEIEAVELYNVLGQLVLQKNIHSAHATIDITGLSAGTYVVRASADGRTAVSKLIKQ